jgi:small GTP-binding protein
LASKPKKRTPDVHLIGTTVKMPAFIRSRDLAKKIGIDHDRIEKYAREEGLKFRNPREIIFDFALCSKFLALFDIKAEYEEIDAVRSDYWDQEKVSLEFPKRPSVISVMGEIDHGKTSLLDALSSSHVADFEPGKITQSLSAFSVDLDPSKSSKEANDFNSTSRVTFLDTPGHAAFENMRLSGASVSDAILLVISAVNGVKPATAQIIKMAKKHWVPIVVAINKIDIATDDQIKSVYKQLRDMGASKIKRSKNLAMKNEIHNVFAEVDDIHPVMAIVEISATEHTNMDILKGVIKVLHQSMEDNLHVNPKANPAEATVIESYSTPGIGRVLLLITHLGTLRVGSHFVTNNCSGIIKSLRLADSRYLASDDSIAMPQTNNALDMLNHRLSLKTGNRSKNQKQKFEAERRSVSKEILEGSVGETIELESIGAGLPVLVSGVKQDAFVPSGAAFFQFDSKERADEVMDFRQTLLEYRTREQNGTLYRADKHGLLLRSKKRVDNDEEAEVDENDVGELDQEGESYESDDQAEELKKNLGLILKADNQGRLDAMMVSARETADAMGFELKLLAKGLGDLTSHELSIAQVEHEENGVPRIPIYLFNVGLDSNATQWMTKHSQAAASLHPKQFDVFLDILSDLKQEIRLKIERQARLTPPASLVSGTISAIKAQQMPDEEVVREKKMKSGSKLKRLPRGLRR